jgi:peptide/nickel transport system permease protein
VTRYLLRRLLHSALLIVGLVTAVFFLVHLAPGDPAELVGEQDLGAAGREHVRARLGLEDPLWKQYLAWAGGLARGDLGESLRQQRPVAAILAEAVPATLLLTISALVVELLAGLVVGILAAWRPRRRAVRALGTGALVLYSLPSFWLALVAIMVFARGLGWLPASGMHAPDAPFLPWPDRLLDQLRHLVLPVLVLGLGNFAVTARFVRTAAAEVLASDWVLAARARGIAERRILWRHTVRGVALPVLTLVGLSLPGLFGGAVAVEEVFGWPGMGRVAVQALLARDYPVIMAVTIIASALVVLGSLLADLACRWVDPRLRLDADGPEVR